MRVLVVDDDDASRYLIATLLEGYGHEVVQAADGVEALENARADDVDVVVSDILMPRMDGYQLCREWKADPKLCKAPLVFYSATYTELADKEFAVSLGADAFFIKPQEPHVLVKLITDAFEKSAGRPAQARPAPDAGEADVLREYSERLVCKLEHKIVELNKANADLASAMEALSEEVDVKKQLIEQLTTDLRGRQAAAIDPSVADEALETALRASPLPMFVVDAGLIVKMFNPASERLFGAAVGEVVGSVCGFDAHLREAVEAAIADDGVVVSGERAYPEEAAVQGRLHRAVVSPLHDASGAVIGAFAVLQPVEASGG